MLGPVTFPGVSTVNKALLAVLVAGAATLAFAQTPSKVGIINIQQAIIATKDGQKAAGELQTKFDPKKKQLEAMQGSIAALQQELAKGSNTMAEAKRTQITRDIDQKTKELQRASEDAQAEFEQEQNKLLNDLGGKLMVVIDKYARDNAYSLILDVSSPQTPVLFAANGVEITKEIVDLYDKNSPASLPPAPKPAVTPAPKPAATKPPAAAKP
ncbi:MAG: OmpH family outer membrane protein [Bryobacterales bacterium]|nr:OmpH family outer membrane protein [Bryobacterales bacterium]